MCPGNLLFNILNNKNSLRLKMSRAIYNPRTNLNYTLRQRDDCSGRRGQIKGLEGEGNNTIIILIIVAVIVIGYIAMV